MAPSNTAAWLSGPKAYPFEVKEAPYTAPGDGEIVVKNATISVNIIDYKMQDPAPYPNEYPAILGQDVAGTVAAIGPNVTRFKEGDRVIGQSVALLSKKAHHGGFQTYTVLPDNMTTKLPNTLSFEQAVTLPLSIGTAACGMYQSDHLNLQRPLPSGAPDTGKSLLIWGGSGGVGFSAIQLARASGYGVITTASPKNHSLLKRLGATHTLDYNSTTIVDDILAATKGKEMAGALVFAESGNNWRDVCTALTAHQKGGKIATSIHHDVNDVPAGVTAKFIFGLALWKNDVSKILYEDYLPAALADGSFVAGPDPEVVGHGIANIQKAVDERKNREVSAKKLIVVL